VPTWTPPVTLVANTNENVNDLNSIFTSLQNTVNGGLDETNVPNLAAAFTTYKPPVAWGGGQTGTAGAGGTFLMAGGPTANAGTGVAAAGAAGTAAWAFYLDPAKWTANARTTKLRLHAQLFVNNVAPATNFVPGLYPVTTSGAASGVDSGVNVGAVVTGSTVAFTTPAATAQLQSTSGDFNAPAAGFYVFAVVIGGAMVAGSRVTLGVQLEMRQV
jgi:hypothetical protein